MGNNYNTLEALPFIMFLRSGYKRMGWSRGEMLKMKTLTILAALVGVVLTMTGCSVTIGGGTETPNQHYYYCYDMDSISRQSLGLDPHPQSASVGDHDHPCTDSELREAGWHRITTSPSPLWLPPTSNPVPKGPPAPTTSPFRTPTPRQV